MLSYLLLLVWAHPTPLLPLPKFRPTSYIQLLENRYFPACRGLPCSLDFLQSMPPHITPVEQPNLFVQFLFDCGRGPKVGGGPPRHLRDDA